CANTRAEHAMWQQKKGPRRKIEDAERPAAHNPRRVRDEPRAKTRRHTAIVKASVRRRSETAEQALDVVELQGRARRIAQTAAQLLQDLARALHVDFVGHLDRGAEIGPFGALWTTQRIAWHLAGRTLPNARAQLPHHVLGHVAGAFPQLL